jgi:putative ABC transport system substrate-binding protein
VTGVAALTIELDAKGLELLSDLAPGAGAIGALVNPSRPDAATQLHEVQTAARTVRRPLVVLSARTERDIETAFAAVARQRLAALLVGADPFFNSRREQIVALAARHAVPAVYQWRESSW